MLKRPTILIVLSAAALALCLALLARTPSASAQTGGLSPQGTPRPTGQPYLGAPQYPLVILPDGTALPSLTGVGGQALNGPVAIRSGPGLEFRRIGRLAQGDYIHIIGWNGWEEDRICSSDFPRDLDMWVQVQTHVDEQRGWIARCVLNIVGDVSALPIVSAQGERTAQR